MTPRRPPEAAPAAADELAVNAASVDRTLNPDPAGGRAVNVLADDELHPHPPERSVREVLVDHDLEHLRSLVRGTEHLRSRQERHLDD